MILHHSVTGWNVHTETIKRWGYSKIIRRSGEVLSGTGNAHTYGHNDKFAVCFIGNYEKEQPTQAMIDSLIKIMRDRKDFNLKGHKDYANNPPGRNITACPGRNLYKLIPQIKEEAMKNYKAKWKKCVHYKNNKIKEIEKLRDDIKSLEHQIKKLPILQETIQELQDELALRAKEESNLSKENKELRKALKSCEPVKKDVIAEENTIKRFYDHIIKKIKEIYGKIQK